MTPTLSNVLNHTFEKDADGTHHVIRTRHMTAAKAAMFSMELYEALLDCYHALASDSTWERDEARRKATNALSAVKVISAADLNA